MENEEEIPFDNLDAWKTKTPKCPGCNKPTAPVNETVTLSRFEQTEYDNCIEEDCSVDDHVINTVVDMSICNNDECSNKHKFAPHPTHAVQRLKCKCEDFFPESLGEMTLHMANAHGKSKRMILQSLLDSKRPEAVVVEGDSVWIGIEKPDQ